jgi:CHAT domain-containing protein
MTKFVYLKTLFIVILLIGISNVNSQDYDIQTERAKELYRVGNFVTAFEIIDSILVNTRKNYNIYNPEYSSILNNTWWVLHNMDEHFMVNKYLKEFIDSARKSEVIYPGSLARVLTVLGNNYGSIGRYSEAEELFIEAVEIYREINLTEPWMISKCLNNFGNFYLSVGRYDEAESLYREAIDSVKSNLKYLTSRRGEYWNRLLNLGSVLYIKGDYNESEKVLKEALILSDSVGEHSKAMTYEALALIYIEKGYYTLADSLFNLVTNINNRLYSPERSMALSTKNTMVTLLLKSRKIEDALLLAQDIYRKAISKLKDFELCDYLFSTAKISWQYSSFINEDSVFNEVFTILKKTFLNNLDSFSEVERSQLWNTLQDNFEIFNSFVIEQNEKKPQLISSMYNNRLFTKACLLNASKIAREKAAKSGDSILVNYLKRWQSDRELLAKYYDVASNNSPYFQKIIDSLKKSANNLEKKINKLAVNLFPDSRRQRDNWNDIKSKLKDKEAAIEIVRFRKYCKLPDKFNTDAMIPQYSDTIFYAALIVTNKTNDHPKLVLLKNGAELESKGLISKYDSLNQVNQQINPLSANENVTYSKYWEPIGKELNGIDKVYLSPDGIYSIINLQTIFDPIKLKYLFDEIDIRIVTSTKDIISQSVTKQSKTNKLAVLFGNPDFNMKSLQHPPNNTFIAHDNEGSRLRSGSMNSGNLPKKWEALPATEEEVKSIGKLLSRNGWTIMNYTGADATEENLNKIESPMILHIASHSAFPGVNDMQKSDYSTKHYYESTLLKSYIVLAGANQCLDRTFLPDSAEDGRLTAFEAMSLNLTNTEIAVLSACGTGLGDIKYGEGVFGLQRALIIAGVKSLIISLWSIPDDDTRDLMISFYQNWLCRKKSKREAFNLAIKELKSKKWSKPASWGAFVMVGE